LDAEPGGRNLACALRQDQFVGKNQKRDTPHNARRRRRGRGADGAAGGQTARPGGVPTLVVELDANDTPDFAAEKVIDILAENGIISLPAAGYTPEEDLKIRRRLQDLGYIE
jgi:hypothetical protein